MCTTWVQGPQRPGEGVRSPRTGVTEGCELPCWDLSLSPLKEQPVPVITEPSLLPHNCLLLKEYSLGHLYIFFTSVDGFLGPFHILAVVSNATINLGVKPHL